MTITTKQQIEQMQGLTIEQKKEISTYLGRAQGRNSDYAIECDGDDAESLLNWWQLHQEKATKRSARRQRREQPERQTIAEQCFDVISELADVYGKSQKEVIKDLRVQIEKARASEYEKAETAKREATMKMDAFRLAHPEFVAEWEILHNEQQKQSERCTQLHTMCEVARAKRGRSKKAEPEQQTRVLF